MKKRDYQIIDMLAKMAEVIEPVKSARIASAVYINGRCVAIGKNSVKTDPLQARFTCCDKKMMIHSEMHAVKQALRCVAVDDLKKATLYVARAKLNDLRENGGQFVWGMAKPCNACQKMVDTFEFKRVVFTQDDQTLGEMVR